MKLKLVVMPDGKSILTTEEHLDPATFDRLREAFEEWLQTEEGFLILSEAEVVQALDIELDIES